MRIVLLVALAVIPAMILLVWSAVQYRQEKIAQARDKVLEAAHDAATTEAYHISQTRHLFMALSHFPPIKQHRSDEVTEIFHQIMSTNKGYTAILATGADGITFATYPKNNARINLMDRGYFREALKTGEFTVGNYVIGRVTGQPMLTMAYPVKSAKGKLVSVLTCGLSTDWLSAILSKATLPRDAHLAVIDANGRLVARTPPAPELIGKPKFAPAVTKSLTMHQEGFYEGIGAGGEKRLYGYTRLGKSKGAVYVMFSIPLQEVLAAPNRVMAQYLALAGVVAIMAMLVAWFMGTGSVVKPVKRLLWVAERVTTGDLDARLGPNEYGAGELGKLAQGFDIMADSLEQRQEERQQAMDELARQNALQTGQAQLADLLRGNFEVEELSREIINFLCEHLGFQVGLLYLHDGDGLLTLSSAYAHQGKLNPPPKLAMGQSLVGQAALEQLDIVIKEVPEDYLSVSSGLGQASPGEILVKPLVRADEIKGVLELGAFKESSQYAKEFLDASAESMAIAMHTSMGRRKLAKALQESQAMSEELQAQQEELRTTNEELEEQARMLKDSEERLRTQQEELQVTNEELEEKNELLTRQKKEVEWARHDLQEKAEELAMVSKYKSEFLANMSHELRTPLNSLLLLAQALADNKEGNLSQEQVEFARIIHSSGSDLLELINEILDLAKIEAGRIDLRLGKVKTSVLSDGVRASFNHMATQKGLELEVVIDPEAPRELVSDQKRIEQILKNLVSNAIKFTEKGRVKVTFSRPRPEQVPSSLKKNGGEHLAVSVRDTGIGIDPNQQRVIFEAFQQADGSTSRRYGGTGLGLSISRELARLLGGAIELHSAPGEGATFTVYLGLNISPGETAETKPAAAGAQPKSKAPVVLWRDTQNGELPIPDAASYITDDREALAPEDRVILVIEDDPKFAKILYRKCHDKGFKCLAAATGEAGLEMARQYLPDAVILDLHLPALDGWSVLGILKEDTRTRHIPVHIISVEQATTESLRKGAVGHATKPIDGEQLDAAFDKLRMVADQGNKRVLVVDDDPQLRRNTVVLIEGGDVEVDEAATGAEAIAAVRANRYDCMVLDLSLPDMDGRSMLETLQQQGREIPPVIVHTAREVTQDEEAALRENTESIIIKDVRSQERLLDEVSLFLHRIVSKMPANKRQIIRNLHEGEEMLAGKRVLVVDDDMRTTFAVAALLSDLGMEPLKANNGQKALQVLEKEPDVDLVLMDIMMPVVDGYDAMRRIRAQDKFRDLPIIALTAKAMPVDREKCLAAGANDYMPKPVDRSKLISMIRVWLYR